MTKRTEKHIESIECEYEDGRRATVDVFQEFLSQPTMSGRGAPMEGMKSARLRSGRPVNYLDEQRFRTVEGEILTRT